MKDIDRIVDCPECHATCGWCSWYAKNAREGGCGCPRSPRGRTVKCEWGESLRGTVCGLCGGVEMVRATTVYESIADTSKASSRLGGTPDQHRDVGKTPA